MLERGIWLEWEFALFIRLGCSSTGVEYCHLKKEDIQKVKNKKYK